jgi:hypothetical protein
MNRIERWARDTINPYSTAVTGWWCHAGRRTPLGRVVTGAASRLSRRAAPGPDEDPGVGGGGRPPPGQPAKPSARSS